MNYTVDERLNKFIQEQVASGRFASGDEVVRAGLLLIEEREARLKALRDHVEAAIAEGGSYTDEEVDEYLAAHDDE